MKEKLHDFFGRATSIMGFKSLMSYKNAEIFLEEKGVDIRKLNLPSSDVSFFNDLETHREFFKKEGLYKIVSGEYFYRNNPDTHRKKSSFSKVKISYVEKVIDEDSKKYLD